MENSTKWVSVDPNNVRKSLSKCFLRPPTSRSVFIGNYCTSTEHPLFYTNTDRDGSCDTFIFFSPSEIKDPPLRIKPYGKNLQNISWHAISYHSDGRKAGCASEESMPAHDYGSLYQNRNRQYEPCVPRSRYSLSWAQHLNELHARRMVVFHMAECPTDTLSLIYLAVTPLTSRLRFNGSHVPIGDSPQMPLPGPTSDHSIVYLSLSGHRCV